MPHPKQTHLSCLIEVSTMNLAISKEKRSPLLRPLIFPHCILDSLELFKAVTNRLSEQELNRGGGGKATGENLD